MKPGERNKLKQAPNNDKLYTRQCARCYICQQNIWRK